VSRLILHIDMNAFFASVEQRDRPELRGKPVAVVGGAGRRGMVLTASYEARPFGVKTGMLWSQAQALCPNLLPVEGRFAAYVAASKNIFSVLETFTERVEMSSVDEAFLDVTEPRRRGDWDWAEGRGRALQSAIHQRMGLPCSVGVAPNKLLAKLASEMKKPRGLTVIRPSDLPELLTRTSVQALSGIGGKTARALEALGIRTCAQAGAANAETLYARFGVWGHWLKRMGQGLDESPVARVDAPDEAKSVGHSTTFPANTADPELVRAYVLHLSEKVGARLRRYGREGREVALTVRDADFKTRTVHRKLEAPVSTDDAIYGAADELLARFLPFRRPVRLVGVSVGRLESPGGQLSLFEATARPVRLAETLDRLNAKYGKGTVTRARTALAKKKKKRGLFG
jgi:DNA polymerase-4